MSRRDRWHEEYNIVKSEIDWTRRFYLYQATRWGDRAEASTERGYAAYAERKVAMWKRLARHASQTQAKFPDVEGEVQKKFLLTNTRDLETANAVLTMYPQS